MEDIIKRVQEGDEIAFKQLTQSIENDLYRVAKTRLSDDDDIKDAIQNTMIITYKNARKIKDINCFKNIKIGNNVVISEELIIRDSDNHRVIENGEEKENTKNIVIGDNVWIGLRSIILKGANIGNGCIVAAGSVVNVKFLDN